MVVPLNTKAPCDIHKFAACPLATADVDITGTVCKDCSRRGNMRGRQGPWAKILLTWLRLHETANTPILIHENVSDFDVEVLTSVMSHKYHIISFPNVQPSDTGLTALGRPRRVDVLLHKDRVELLGTLDDIRHTYTSLAEHVQGVTVDIDDLWCETSREVFAHEMLRTANQNCGQVIDATTVHKFLADWRPLLSQVERANVNNYEALWRDKFGTDPTADHRAIYHLSQNATARPTHANALGVMPTYTAGSSARIYKSMYKRWFTGREKANTMLLPVYEEPCVNYRHTR